MHTGMHFGNNDAHLLRRAGYAHTFVPEQWKDIGGPENGPKVVGHPDLHIWTLELTNSYHEIIVVHGIVEESGYTPKGPECWGE